MDKIITIAGIILGSSVVSSITTLLLARYLEYRKNSKDLYGKLKFHLARLNSVIKNRESILGKVNKNGILDRASFQNQGEAMSKIYKVLGNNFQYLQNKHEVTAQNFIDAHIDQSNERAKKLLDAIESLRKEICN